MPNDDYILRSDAKEALTALPADLDAETVQRCIEAMNNPKVADVEPKRKTGFWTDSEVWIDYENNARETVRCSLCNSAVDVHCAKNYCTYCGAMMLPEPPKEKDDGADMAL